MDVRVERTVRLVHVVEGVENTQASNPLKKFGGCIETFIGRKANNMAAYL
jgi:hypothetical protein